jgi:hypothetical protein
MMDADQMVVIQMKLNENDGCKSNGGHSNEIMMRLCFDMMISLMDSSCFFFITSGSFSLSTIFRVLIDRYSLKVLTIWGISKPWRKSPYAFSKSLAPYKTK